MKAFNGYDEAKVYGQTKKLPTGGYVLKIKDVRLEEGKNGNSDQLVIAFDIAEGDQKGFFEENFKAQTQEDKKWKGTYRLWCPKDDGSEQDGWTKDKFKTFIYAVEESNEGFHWNWDEKKLKGKTFAGIFNEKEYDFNGKHGFYTNLHSPVPVEVIRNGSYTVPEPTRLKGSTYSQPTAASADGFMNIPEGVDEEVPF